MTQKTVNLDLTTIDGNAFSLMGHFQKQARKEKWPKEEIDEVLKKCQSGDYDNLVATLVEHCEPLDDVKEEEEI